MLRPKRERRPGWDAVPSSRVNGVVVQVLHLVTAELERENIYPEKINKFNNEKNYHHQLSSSSIIINHHHHQERSMLTAWASA